MVHFCTSFRLFPKELHRHIDKSPNGCITETVMEGTSLDGGDRLNPCPLHYRFQVGSAYGKFPNIINNAGYTTALRLFIIQCTHEHVEQYPGLSCDDHHSNPQPKKGIENINDITKSRDCLRG